MSSEQGSKAGAKSEEFWSKVLSASKVKRILAKRGFDPEAFRRDYEADNTRAGRGLRRPSNEQISAVEAFQRTGDFDGLKRALGTRSAAVANATLRRVVQFQAQGGTKTIRRRGASPA